MMKTYYGLFQVAYNVKNYLYMNVYTVYVFVCKYMCIYTICVCVYTLYVYVYIYINIYIYIYGIYII